MSVEAKEALVIGASEEAAFAIRTAQERGYQVTAIDGNPEAGGFVFADHAIVADIRDTETIMAAIAGMHPKMVLPVPIGRYLTATGVVNDRLGLNGVTEATAQLCTDKYRFHLVLAAQGLRDGDCLLLPEGSSENQAAAAVARFVSSCGYARCILKPRFGSGSRGVVMLEPGVSPAAYLDGDGFLDEDLIVEPAYPGIEFGADAIVNEGTLHMLLLREKLISPAPWRQAVAYIANHLDDGMNALAQEYLQRIANTLHMRDCVVHCDLMWDGERFMVIEISARPSGHNLHNLFVPFVTGVNEIAAFIDICEGRAPNLRSLGSQEGVFLIGYYDHEPGQLRSVPTPDQLSKRFSDALLDFRLALEPGYIERTTEGHGLMQRGHFLLRTNTYESVLELRESLLEFVFADFEE